MEVAYIVAFALAITNVVKKNVNATLVPVITVLLATAFGAGFAVLSGQVILDFAVDTFTVAMITTGLFVAGDAVRGGVIVKR